jgi:hypothetical protein
MHVLNRLGLPDSFWDTGQQDSASKSQTKRALSGGPVMNSWISPGL